MRAFLMPNIIVRTIRIAAIILITARSPEVLSQSSADSSSCFSEYVTVVAGKDYKVTGVVQSVLGLHWRDLWATPFKAGVLELDCYAGGLNVLKKGGGLQTKSLHFKGNDGRRYKFRSIDKDPRLVLPPELRNSLVADAFKDQISASHPFASVIVSRMLDEIGVLNAKPFVAVLPDDPSLGEFREQFGGLLGTIEINPTESKDSLEGFAGADKIIDTYELYEKLEKDNDNVVDAAEFLKARLFDLMVGDWDRHYDQWLWAGFKSDGKTVYKPIPRDRDQAFSLYDGLLPMIAGRAITQIEGYGKDYPDVYDLSFNGRYVDRRILPAVEWYVYDSLSRFIQSKLNDRVIDEALGLMPAEWHKYGHDKLKDMIISRRDKLREAADDYYDLINGVADIYGSDKNEEIVITCNEEYMKVEVFKKKKDGTVSEKPVFSRHFDPDYTDDLRIYLNKGDDNVKIRGTVSPNGESYLYYPLDVKLIYDKGRKSIDGKDAAFIDVVRDQRSKVSEKERYEPAVEDRGYDWRLFPLLNYNSDDGLVIGGGPIVYHYDYLVKPFDYRIAFGGAYAFGSKGYTLLATGEFHSIFRGYAVKPVFNFSQLEITRFFGLGNETSFDQDLEDKDYYNIDQNLLLAELTLTREFDKRTSLSLTPFLKSALVYEVPDTYLYTLGDLYGTGKLSFVGVNGQLTYDSRNNTSYPQRGYYIRVYGNITPAVMKNNFLFGKTGIDARAYFSTDTTKGIALALRAAAGKVWGTFPFYEALFLGGVNSLKGYTRERFAGDGLLLAQGELRMPITLINILVPGILGVSGFGGVGRVFLESETSHKWHSSYGASLWITYLNRSVNFELSLSKSFEGYRVSVGSAFFL